MYKIDTVKSLTLEQLLDILDPQVVCMKDINKDGIRWIVSGPFLRVEASSFRVALILFLTGG